MILTPKQKKEAYRQLSPEVQDFIMDNDTTELIGSYLTNAGLSEEQANMADSEIFCVIYGLQTLSEAMSNIAKLANKNASDFSKLKIDLENNIFNKIEEIKKQSEEKSEEVSEEVSDQKVLVAQEIKGETKVTIDNRIAEIGKKYSLNNAQLDMLINKVGIAIKYPAQKSGLVQTLVTGLTISKLLAEQIMADLETRVFEYAINQIESKNKTEKEKLAEPIVKKEEVKPTPVVVEVKKAPEVAPNIPTAPTVPKVPEVALQNLPMVENPGTRAELSTGQRNEQVKVLPTLKTILEKKPEPKPEVTVETKPEVKIAPMEKPAEGNKIEIKKPEPIQRPIPVPRFTAVPLPEEADATPIPIRTPTPAPAKATEPAPIPQPQPAPTPVTPPVSPATPAPEKPAETKPAEPIVKKYVVDPYREPLN